MNFREVGILILLILRTKCEQHNSQIYFQSVEVGFVCQR